MIEADFVGDYFNSMVIMRKYFSLYIVLCLALLILAGCRKDDGGKGGKDEFEIDKLYERGSLTVHIQLDKSKITIAETTLLRIEATVEQGYEVDMPKVAEVLENFGIVDCDNLGSGLDEKNNIVQIRQYRLEPFLSGQYQIPSFTFHFYDANSTEAGKYELVTEPVDVEVSSLLGAGRENPVIADIEDVVEMPKEPSYWWVWTTGIVIVAGGIIFWLRAGKRRISELVKVFMPAHEIAYERLRKLAAKKLIEAGKIKQFYEEISNILRHYIEHRFELRAPERTTEEFLAELQYAESLSKAQKDDLAKFLTHCDLVKFAKHSPTEQQIQQRFESVKNFIEKTKSDERKVEVAQPIPDAQAQAELS